MRARTPPVSWIIENAPLATTTLGPDLTCHVTNHAADRYVQRIDRLMHPAGALTFLRSVLPVARLQDVRTNRGHERWLLPDGKAVVVARYDPKQQLHVAVTVLGPNELVEDEEEVVSDVVAAYRRATAANDAPRFKAPTQDPPPPPVAAAPPPPKPFVPARTRLEVVAPAVMDDAHRTLQSQYRTLSASHRDLLAAHTKLKAQRVASPDAPQAQIASLERQVAEWKARALAAEQVPIGERTGRVARAEAHAKHMEEQTSVARKRLRTAVVALRVVAEGRPDAAGEALASLEADDPGITSDYFCWPERFTKEEHQAAGAARRRAAALPELASEEA